MIDKLISKFATLATQIISSSGYFGVFILMAAESTMIPLPSELIMPFAGYLAYTGKFNFWFVVLISGIGSIFGSLFSYYLGKYGGEPFLKKYGNFFLINQEDLKWTNDWFKRKGEATIFVSRFIPVVRHLISLPAGVAQMNLEKFIIYTFLGATIWNGFLAYLGYLFGKNWLLIHEYTRPLSYTALILLIAGAIYFIYKHLKHGSKQKKKKTRK